MSDVKVFLHKKVGANWVPVEEIDFGSNISFLSLTNKPTDLAGYGITDAAPIVHTHTISQISDGGNLARRNAGNALVGAQHVIGTLRVSNQVANTDESVITREIGDSRYSGPVILRTSIQGLPPGRASTSMIVTGSLNSGSGPIVFPTLWASTFLGGKPFYSSGNGKSTCRWDGEKWVLMNMEGVSASWTSASKVATPDLASGWVGVGSASGTPSFAVGPTSPDASLGQWVRLGDDSPYSWYRWDGFLWIRFDNSLVLLNATFDDILTNTVSVVGPAIAITLDNVFVTLPEGKIAPSDNSFFINPSDLRGGTF